MSGNYDSLFLIINHQYLETTNKQTKTLDWKNKNSNSLSLSNM